jgi:RimJ/RimL family protein N-acetyltransferase
MPIVIKKPKVCAKAEIDAFETLVRSGGQTLVHGLRQGISRAQKLGFYFKKGALAGVAALKNPGQKRVHSLFRRAGVPQLANFFKNELGYASVLPEYRKNGVCTGLFKKLLKFSKGKTVYATTRDKNARMIKILKKLGFKRLGKRFPSLYGPHWIHLFVLLP